MPDLPQCDVEDGQDGDNTEGTDVEHLVGLEDIQVDSHKLRVLNLIKGVRTQVETNGASDGSKEDHCALEAVNVHRLVEEATNTEYQRNGSHDEHDAAPEQLGLNGVLVELVGRNRLLALQRNPYEQDNQRDEHNA